MARKTGAKTAISPLNGAEMPTGAHPKNTGGKKGRSGRPPQAWKAFCASVASDPEFQDAMRQKAIAGDAGVAKLIVEHAEGKPTQPVSTQGELTVRLVRVPYAPPPQDESA